MCYEFDSHFFRARALEALRRKVKDVDEASQPAAPAPSTAPAEPAVPAMKPETVPA